MASAMTTQISTPPSDGVDAACGFDREPGTTPLTNQLSIQQLVAHLSDSAQRVQERIGAAHSLDKSSVQQPEPPMPENAQGHKPAQATVNPEKFGLHDSFGAAMTTALSQAVSVGRFNAVRDSLTGDQKEERAALSKSFSPSDAMAAIEDAEAIPRGFRRLNSPRAYKQSPDPFQQALKAQVECLPMLYADQLQGHIVDMRSLLGPGVWDRVQQAVDWTDWTDEEKLAALNTVLIARNRDSVMNAVELEEARNKPQSLQLPSRAQAQPKRQRSDDSHFTVVANSNGISIKQSGEQPPRQLTEEEAIELMQAMRGSVQMATDKGNASSAQRVQQMLQEVPTVAYPVPSETNPPRFAAPADSFWQDIEAQVLESLRQAERAPRIADLVCSTEEAIFLHSKQRHYAQLASRLFGEQVAATRLQAAWRCYSTRKWFRTYKKTAEFTQRQQEYEQQMREKWAEEEAAERERIKARASKADKDDWNQKSRYMQNAVRSTAKSMQGTIARESLESFKRREQGLVFLEEGKAYGKHPSDLSVGQSGINGRATHGARANKQKLSGSLLTAKPGRSNSGSPPPVLNRDLARSISDASIQSHSSMGNTSHTSGIRDTRQRPGRPEDTRSGWLAQATGISDEPEAKAIDESMSTERLRERKKKRQQRKEAAMQLAQMPPEARAAARSVEERISRRIAVMEQVLGPDNAGRFEQGMHAPIASSSPEGNAACNVLPTISESPAPSAQGECSDVFSVAGWSNHKSIRPTSAGPAPGGPGDEPPAPFSGDQVPDQQSHVRAQSMECVLHASSDENNGTRKEDPDGTGHSMGDASAWQDRAAMQGCCDAEATVETEKQSPQEVEHGTINGCVDQDLDNAPDSSLTAPEAVHVPNIVPFEDPVHESGAASNPGEFLNAHDSFEWTSTPSCTALHAADGGVHERTPGGLASNSQPDIWEVPSTLKSEAQAFWKVSQENCVPEGGPAAMTVAVFPPGTDSQQDEKERDEKDTCVSAGPITDRENVAEERAASKQSTHSEASSTQEWTNRMVPASGEPLERDSLNMPVQELTLARLPECGRIRKVPDRSASARSSASLNSRDVPVSCADGNSCTWSARTGAPWQRPEESAYQTNARSSPGNSQSHSQGGRLMLSHDGTYSSAPETDGTYGYQLQVQGSGIDLLQGSQSCSTKKCESPAKALDDSTVHTVPSGTCEQARSRVHNAGAGSSGSPAEVALQYIQQQLETQASTCASLALDDWAPARAFSLTTGAGSRASFGAGQPVANEADVPMHRLNSSSSVQRSSSFLPYIHRGGSTQGANSTLVHTAAESGAEPSLTPSASGVVTNGGYHSHSELRLAGMGQYTSPEQNLHPVDHLGADGLPRLASRPVTDQGFFPGGVHGNFATQPDRQEARGREVNVTSDADKQGVPLSGTLSDINKAIQKLRQGEVKGVDDVLGRVLRKDRAADVE